MSDDDERAALLAQVLAHPDDDEPRLVFADWLSQRGDPRGEFITVQCAIAAGRGDYRALVERERALMVHHAGDWTGHAKPFAVCTLHRGFISTIKTSASRFAAEGAPYFERDPIEELIVQRANNPGLVELAAAPHLARLRRLHLRRTIVNRADADALARLFPALGSLRELTLILDFARAADALAATLFEGVAWPALERLAVHVDRLPDYLHAGDGLGPVAWRSLATATLPALRALSIDPHAEVPLLSAAFPDAQIKRLVL